MPAPPGYKQINPTIPLSDDERLTDVAQAYGVEKLWLASRLIWYGLRHVKAAMAEWKDCAEQTFADQDDRRPPLV